MSLYNALFGRNPFAPLLLAMLHLEEVETGRFRDCYLARGTAQERQDLPPEELAQKERRIVVFTRNGGGNRESYERQIELMRLHPEFVTDYDDDFDSTYATFEFRVPKEFGSEVQTLDEFTGGEKPVEEPMKKFAKLIDDLKRGDLRSPAAMRAAEVGKKIFDQINAAIAEVKP